MYKFRVKESCFSSLFGSGFSLKRENSNSVVSIWRIYDESVVTCEWQSEECGEEQMEGQLQAASMEFL